jgi:hypothetical protein
MAPTTIAPRGGCAVLSWSMASLRHITVMALLVQLLKEQLLCSEVRRSTELLRNLNRFLAPSSGGLYPNVARLTRLDGYLSLSPLKLASQLVPIYQNLTRLLSFLL